MTSRAVKLQPAVEQAHHRSEAALAQLAQQQQLLAAGERQLSELQRYRLEYAQSGDGSQTVGALLNRQGFVERIDQAIAQQTWDLARLGRQLEQAREHWRYAHARESALSSVVQQHLERERQAEDRNEQSEVDERMQYRRPQR
ncbi:MAG: flagellar export protein FliJ [Rhodanobacter sp.]